MPEKPENIAESVSVSLALTTEVVAAYVGNNTLTAIELSSLIRAVQAAFAGLGETAAPAQESVPQPVVPIKKSVFPDYIVCLEDGKRLKILKRHLATAYGMTPEQYRAKWNLPSTYPMVAPRYAEQRAALARSIGLGRRAPEPPPPPAPEKPARERPRKAAAAASDRNPSAKK